MSGHGRRLKSGRRATDFLIGADEVGPQRMSTSRKAWNCARVGLVFAILALVLAIIAFIIA